MVENVSPTLCTHLILGLVVVIFAASSTVVTVSQSLLDVSHADPAAPTLYIIQRRLSPMMFGNMQHVLLQFVFPNVQYAHKQPSDVQLLLLLVSEQFVLIENSYLEASSKNISSVDHSQQVGQRSSGQALDHSIDGS